ncbi:NAD-dependent epimerase/dehydratase family protein [Chryseobacterium formosus]|uniref:NAD-dependent epimerase/dehydratase family protein n=1 Tax=Chryseobacterium formosus TaxID=1537363 RepID=A0ABT3XN42_9FLAO|nr:NAD-dependent epimerase/dehydratase family protein [Chryseobacterium formosus]MCX8523535.1 NAD-dependent epimerase/dehydratase family protein [Chryseobacterium formosus]
MKKTIAIIGGGGFIGINFTTYFSANNFDVTVIDRHIRTNFFNSNIKIKNVDIHNTDELVKAVGDVDYILWLVHASVPSTTELSLTDDFSINISPIIKFLEQIQNVKKFIYLSSGGTVYGDIKESFPVAEEFNQKPISNYGLSKSVAEKYIEFITTQKEIESVILRPSNVYGPHQNLIKPQGIIGYAFKSIKDSHSLDLYNEGKVIRDFIYVEDLAKAVEKFLINDVVSGKTSFYNVGSGEGFSIMQVLEKIEIITGEKLQLTHKSSRDFDCEYSVLDVSKLEKEKKWSITTSLDEGLLKVWKWIKYEY